MINSIIQTSLKPGGHFLITFPIGQNPTLDEALFKGRLPFDTIYGLKRITRWNRWQQENLLNLRDVKYNFPYIYGNGLAVCITKKKGEA